MIRLEGVDLADEGALAAALAAARATGGGGGDGARRS